MFDLQPGDMLLDDEFGIRFAIVVSVFQTEWMSSNMYCVKLYYLDTKNTCHQYFDSMERVAEYAYTKL